MSAVELPKFDESWAFFFDIDGTLAEIAPTPEDAVIPKTTIGDLLELQKRTGVALVSGRSLASIDTMTAPQKFPAAGQHGLELRFADSEIFYVGNRELIASLTDGVKLFQANHPGLIVEFKGQSIAIHYRMRPDLADVVKVFVESLLKDRDDVLAHQRGKMVDEIKLRGGNKGTAIEAFMRMPGFQNKMPVFAGDDLTDEDAHRVVNNLGGVSIQIGAASNLARYSLPSPKALRSWIAELVTLEMAEL